MPSPIISFYKKNVDFVTEQAVAPDKRRYTVDAEAARHYIDYDYYDTAKTFNVIPHFWNDAVSKYTEDTLQKNGILPWQIFWTFKGLENAFEEKDWEYALVLSADLGHYIADAHVPLHTTHNYNGQLTNQHGIHGFWESRLPELYIDDYDFWVGKAVYIEKQVDIIWQTIKESHLAVDSVLKFEAYLNNTFPEDQKYAIENKGRRVIKTYSEEYSKKYNDMLDDMVERRMKKAVHTVASFWYTAWVNAGSPLPSDTGSYPISESLKETIKKLDLSYENGKIKGRDHEDY